MKKDNKKAEVDETVTADKKHKITQETQERQDKEVSAKKQNSIETNGDAAKLEDGMKKKKKKRSKKETKEKSNFSY